MNRTKKAISLLLAIVITLSSLAAGGVSVEAAAKKPTFEAKNLIDYLTFSQLDDTRLLIYNTGKKSKISNIKIGNTSVVGKAKAKYDSDWVIYENGKYQSFWYLDLDVKKAGTTTISCTVKQNGKSYKISCNYTVAKWVNPIARLDIGDESFDKNTKGFFETGQDSFFIPESKYSYWNIVDDDYEEEFDLQAWKAYASSVEIKIYLKNGFKLKKAYIGKDGKVVKKFKNGKAVNLSKYDNLHDIVFVIYDTKNKCNIELYIMNVWGEDAY